MKCNTKIRSRIKALHAEGLTDRQIADTLGLLRCRVSQFRRRMDLPINGSKRYSQADLDYIRDNYGMIATAAIAARLGRSITLIYQAAARLGLCKCCPRLVNRPGLVETLKARHAAGWSDSEISRELHTDRHHIANLRRRLGLADLHWTEHRRQRVREKTAEQLREAGVASLGQLRVEVFHKRAREQGWPEDLKPRQVEILNLLWDNGPMTREELGRRMGMRKKGRTLPSGRIGYWFPMHHNTPGHGTDTSYTGNLLKRGLIINLGRIVRNKRPGRETSQGLNTCLYSLPLDIKRSLHANHA